MDVGCERPFTIEREGGGMADALLFDSNDSCLWRAALGSYHRVLEQKETERRRRKQAKAKDEGLIELDRWYQQTLPELIASRANPHLTHTELCKLMTWKLTRGKFRPRLSELVQQNPPAEVEEVTRQAIKMLPDLKRAIKHLCQLKAVGPATASAVLCAASPDLVPFMADEAVLSVPGLGKIEYTLTHYTAYATKIRDKAKQLNRSESGEKWTCHDVEKALSAYHLAGKVGVVISPAEREGEGPSVGEEKGEREPETKRRKKD